MSKAKQANVLITEGAGYLASVFAPTRRALLRMST